MALNSLQIRFEPKYPRNGYTLEIWQKKNKKKQKIRKKKDKTQQWKKVKKKKKTKQKRN